MKPSCKFWLLYLPMLTYPEVCSASGVHKPVFRSGLMRNFKTFLADQFGSGEEVANLDRGVF